MPRDEFIEELITTTQAGCLNWQKKEKNGIGRYGAVINGLDLELTGHMLRLYKGAFQTEQVAEYYVPDKRLFNAIRTQLQQQRLKQKERIEQGLISRLKDMRNV